MVLKKTCQRYRWRYRGTYPRDTKILTIATSQPETNNSASGKENDTTDFPITAPAANPVFYRTYSRKLPAGRESWEQVNARNLDGLKKLGGLNEAEINLMQRMQQRKKKLFHQVDGFG